MIASNNLPVGRFGIFGRTCILSLVMFFLLMVEFVDFIFAVITFKHSLLFLFSVDPVGGPVILGTVGGATIGVAGEINS